MISFRKKRSSSHDLIFAEECNAAHLAVHSEEWRSLFADSEGRKYFLQMLDEKRGRSALLHPRGFRALTTAMQVIIYKICLLLIENRLSNILATRYS